MTLSMSENTRKYFDTIETQCKKALKIAEDSRKIGCDPTRKVEIKLAKNMAERVIGLISVVCPQIVGTGAEERIIELESEYGVLDWRVAFKIAEEVAMEKFCKFKDKIEAMEVGIRTGFTYVTLGIVSSPLEGLTSIEVKKRKDGKEYICLNYSGPIRNAGGTAASVSILIADYVRKKFSYDTYDPDEKERGRTYVEISDYHEYVTNLQYFPSKKEVEFLMRNIPVEISGDPSEKYEISNINYKDLPRVPTNRLRSGFCLIHSSCIPLKAPKIWKQLEKWGKDMDMEHWSFLEKFLTIQKKSKAEGEVKTMDDKITPDFTYIKDLVAGRPVLAHPLRRGGFRLRYGRTRCSGFSAQSISPVTMRVLNNFIATATQLKVERPGKAAAFTVCDSIDGPIVKLTNGDVVALKSESEAKACAGRVAEIIYLGDVLINYGDFLDRAHTLVPPGYCEEWWHKELLGCLTGKNPEEKAKDFSRKTGIEQQVAEEICKNPFYKRISSENARTISTKLNIPLHPKHTFFWDAISNDELVRLLEEIANASFAEQKIIFEDASIKEILESAGIPHLYVNKTHIVIEGAEANSIRINFGIKQPSDAKKMIERVNKDFSVLENLKILSGIEIKNKSGVFIGCRMGRPEKAKMRKLTGSPHVLFPVGVEGGRLRCFQSAMDKGKITADFAVFVSPKSGKEIPLPFSHEDNLPALKRYYNQKTGITEIASDETVTYRRKAIDIQILFNQMLEILGEKIYPDLIKGVRGTINVEHIPEHLFKGIIRAKHDIYVNKDGTTRYDCSEVPLTHFTPEEVNTPVDRLIELGYKKDILGNPLVSPEQILELKIQDIVIPCCTEAPDEACDTVLFRVANFVDELLVKLYKQKPYYNLKAKKDLVGHYIIGLAPHTSAGSLGRIVGFSKTQGFFAHPMFHAAMRRDCDGDESCIFLLMDGLLNFSNKYLPSSRGSTMDAPLVLTYNLNPSEVDDMVFNMDVVDQYPLEFYEACEKHKKPGEVKIDIIDGHLGKPSQFEGMKFTHPTKNINKGVLCSAYKTLPSMEDKLKGQMALAVKIRAVDERDVARLVIEKHFIRDTKGNLRKFSQQVFRCVDCNEKYRRPPLLGRCTSCGGRIIFTVSQGSVIKYLNPSISLAEKYGLDKYLQQNLELTKRRIDDYFGKDPEKQEGLGKWFAKKTV
ncbi:DNA polymerase II large subunit [Candidatus Woesearchaeota archaeon]|nr:DNA polymerase II large subunit [Candidatus Woesearchaeota archaeon]